VSIKGLLFTEAPSTWFIYTAVTHNHITCKHCAGVLWKPYWKDIFL